MFDREKQNKNKNTRKHQKDKHLIYDMENYKEQPTIQPKEYDEIEY